MKTCVKTNFKPIEILNSLFSKTAIVAVLLFSNTVFAQFDCECGVEREEFDAIRARVDEHVENRSRWKLQFITDDCEVIEYGDCKGTCIVRVHSYERSGEPVFDDFMGYCFQSIPDPDNLGLESALLKEAKKLPGSEYLEKATIFPNPIAMGNELTVTIPTNVKIDQLQVVDLSGRIVLSTMEIKEGTNQLNLSNLDKGIYLIKYGIVGGTIESEKLIIN